MDRLGDRINEYFKYRDAGYNYYMDFKAKLTIDLECEIPKYIIVAGIDDTYKNIKSENKFQLIFNIEAKLDNIFHWLRLGDWHTALFHISMLKPDEDVSEGLINDIIEDIKYYIKTNYNAAHNTVEDMSLYQVNKSHHLLTIKRKL